MKRFLCRRRVEYAQKFLEEKRASGSPKSAEN